jgi:site-specific recombinase XerC
VRRALKVAAKLAVPKGKQKLPLDRRDLRRVVYALTGRGSVDFQGVRDRALFLLGWVGMFRSSELVSSVTWRDVCFAKEGGALI